MKNNFFLNYICASSLVLSPSWSVAKQNQATATSDKGVETTAGSSGPSVKDSADKTSDSNKTGQAMSYLTGGMFISMGYQDISKGYAKNPTGWGLVAKGVMEVMMGMLSMKQGKAHGGTSSAAFGTGFNTDGFGDLYNGSNNDPYDLNDPNNPLNRDPSVAAVKSNLAKLEQMGVLNTKTGTAKIGDKTYKMSDFKSAEAMAAAGIPQGAISGLMDLAGKIEKKAQEKYDKMKLGSMTAAGGFEEGGGGFGAGSSAGDDPSAYAGTGLGGAAGSGLNLNRDPSSMAGMQKNYNGEPIGVAADSIFLMMTRRYKVKESQESFYTDAELALQK